MEVDLEQGNPESPVDLFYKKLEEKYKKQKVIENKNFISKG